MDALVPRKTGSLIRPHHKADGLPKIEQVVQMQEQFTGLVPLRLERPAAEILAERLTRPCPTGTCPIFIP
jgi:hypothetical protein